MRRWRRRGAPLQPGDPAVQAFVPEADDADGIIADAAGVALAQLVIAEAFGAAGEAHVLAYEAGLVSASSVRRPEAWSASWPAVSVSCAVAARAVLGTASTVPATAKAVLVCIGFQVLPWTPQKSRVGAAGRIGCVEAGNAKSTKSPETATLAAADSSSGPAAWDALHRIAMFVTDAPGYPEAKAHDREKRMSIDTPDRTATRKHTIKPVQRTADRVGGGRTSGRAARRPSKRRSRATRSTPST